MVDVNRNVRITLDIVRGRAQETSAVIRDVQKLKGGMEEITTSYLKFNKRAEGASEVLKQYQNGAITAAQAIEQITNKSKGMTQAQLNQQWLAKTAKKAGLSQRDLRQQVNRNGISLSQMAGKATKNGKAMGKLTKQTKEARKAYKGFQMQWLSTMFAGMALYNAMTALLRPAFQAVGIFDLISTILTVLFLPVALQVLDRVLKIGDYFMNLSDRTKLIIGWIVILVAGFGLFLLVLSQLVLGVLGLIVVWKEIVGWFGKIFLSVRGLIGGVTKLIFFGGILIAMFSLLAPRVSAASDSIKETGKSVKESGNFIDNFIDKIKNLWSTIKKAKKEGNLGQMLYENITKFVSSIVSFLVSNIPVMIQNGANLLIAIIDGISKNAAAIGNAIALVITTIVKFISENISTLVNAAVLILQAIVDGIIQNIDVIVQAVTVIVKAIADFIKQNGPIIWDAIKQIFGAIFSVIQEEFGTTGVVTLILVLIGAILNAFGLLGPALSELFSSVIWPLITSAFSAIGTYAMSAMTAIAAAIGWPVIAVVAVIVALIAGIYLAFKENFLGMQEFGRMFIEGFKQMFSGLITFFSGIWDIIRGIFTGNADLTLQGVKKIFQGLWDFVVGLFKGIGSLVSMIIIGAIRIIVGLVQSVINSFIVTYDKIAQFFGGKGTSYRVDLVGLLSAPKTQGSFQDGGVIPSTGAYTLHKGETVVPAGGFAGSYNYAPNINVNADISSDMDIRRLASELNKYWVSDFERLTKSRTTV